MPESPRRQPIGPAHIALGNYIRAHRERKGMTLRALAGIASYAHLSEIENGHATPSNVLIVRLSDELGGNRADLRRLLASAREEQRDEKERRREQREGPSEPRDVPGQATRQQPVLEVVDSKGLPLSTEVMDIRAGSVDIAGPFVIEAIEEHIIIGSSRIIEQATYVREVQATEDGFQLYRYAMEDSPTAIINRITFGAYEPAQVARVYRQGPTSYIFEIKLAEPLRKGEKAKLRFFSLTEGRTYEDDGLLIKQQQVATQRIRLSVTFRSDAEPHSVWWFDPNYAVFSEAVAQAPFFDPARVIARPPTGIYEWEFEPVTGPGRLVGLAWTFDHNVSAASS